MDIVTESSEFPPILCQVVNEAHVQPRFPKYEHTACVILRDNVKMSSQWSRPLAKGCQKTVFALFYAKTIVILSDFFVRID